MDKIIYKFMRLEDFLALVLKKSLTFLHPSLWDDPYETHIFEIYKNHYGDLLSATSATAIYNNTFAQSWTRCEESDALWRIYSDNKFTSVRIAVKEEKMKEIGNVIINDIIYTTDFSPKNNETNIFEILSKKRKAFEHEKEVRVFVDTQNRIAEDFVDNLKLDESGENLDKDSILNYASESKKELKLSIKSISFAHIDNFIDSVILNPLAKDHVNEIIELLCKDYGLNYLGKSTLYTVKSL